LPEHARDQDRRESDIAMAVEPMNAGSRTVERHIAGTLN
jgi:phage terminase large subunit-like protein